MENIYTRKDVERNLTSGKVDRIQHEQTTLNIKRIYEGKRFTIVTKWKQSIKVIKASFCEIKFPLTRFCTS